MSLYGEYIKERLNREIIENDKGFATYYFLNDSCYIENIFIKKEFRHSGEASSLADQISQIAKEKKCNQLIGTVMPSANNSTDSLETLLAYGFKLSNSIQDFIVMVKEL